MTLCCRLQSGPGLPLPMAVSAVTRLRASPEEPRHNTGLIQYPQIEEYPSNSG
jgi:hypothetical protein